MSDRINPTLRMHMDIIDSLPKSIRLLFRDYGGFPRTSSLELSDLCRKRGEKYAYDQLIQEIEEFGLKRI